MPDLDEFVMVDRLAEVSKLNVPKQLMELKGKAIRFAESIDKNDMEAFILKNLGI